MRQTDEDNNAAYTPTAIPADFIALLETDTATEPGLGPALAGARTIPLIPSDEASLPGPPEAPPGQPDVQPPLVIGGRVEPAVLIEQSMPVYPAVARTARVEGIVVLEGTVSMRGKVENLQVVSGHPMLVDAAIHAVKKWKYRPAKLNGQLIPCPVTIQVRFSLQYLGG